MPEITVDLSPQSIKLLEDLTRWGIYGYDVSDVAGRFIDKCLIDLAERGLVKLEKPKQAIPPMEFTKRF